MNSPDVAKNLPVVESSLPALTPAHPYGEAQGTTIDAYHAITPGGLSRRNFLGLLGGFGAGMVAASKLAATVEASTSMITMEAFGPDAESVPSEVPPELQGKNIPRTNEHYRPSPMSVLQDGIEAFIEDGGRPFYRQPDNYLTQTHAFEDSLRASLNSGRPEMGVDNTNSAFFSFARYYQVKTRTLHSQDPGSSAYKDVAQKLATVPDVGANKTGAELDKEYERQDSQRGEIIAHGYLQHFEAAREHIEKIKGTGLASTADLFRYYLNHNQGDISTSIVDTALFLKMAARTNLATLAKVEAKKVPANTPIKATSYEGAKLLSSLFHDEFVSEVPLEWLVENVPSDSRLNNIDGDANRVYKDFDPVNRDGTFYHIWNMFLLCTTVDPEAVKKMTIFYYNRDGGLQHGRIKTRADANVLNETERISALFKRYQVNV